MEPGVYVVEPTNKTLVEEFKEFDGFDYDQIPDINSDNIDDINFLIDEETKRRRKREDELLLNRKRKSTFVPAAYTPVLICHKCGQRGHEKKVCVTPVCDHCQATLDAKTNKLDWSTKYHTPLDCPRFPYGERKTLPRGVVLTVITEEEEARVDRYFTAAFCQKASHDGSTTKDT